MRKLYTRSLMKLKKIMSCKKVEEKEKYLQVRVEV